MESDRDDICTWCGKRIEERDATRRRRRLGVAAVKMKGWRISAPAGALGYDIRAICPEKHWETFKPTVERIIGSARSGPR